MLLLVLLGALLAAGGARASCGACFERVCYNSTLIYTGISIYGQLAIDRSDNTVHFHFVDSDNYDFNAYYNVNDFNFQLIPGLGFTFARAVDAVTHDVYLSRAKGGFYKFNPTTKLVESVDISNATIAHMQYKDKLYYSTHKRPGLYSYENGASTPISALSEYEIDQFVIDKRNDIYFRQDNKIYRLANGSNRPSLFKDGAIYSLTTDNADGVYLVDSVSLGMYKVEYTKVGRPLKEVGAFGSGLPYGVVFDSDNYVVYHDLDTHEMYHLTPSNRRCTVTAGGTGNSMRKTVSSMRQ